MIRILGREVAAAPTGGSPHGLAGTWRIPAQRKGMLRMPVRVGES
jgi:hypothetical protein